MVSRNEFIILKSDQFKRYTKAKFPIHFLIIFYILSVDFYTASIQNVYRKYTGSPNLMQAKPLNEYAYIRVIQFKNV